MQSNAQTASDGQKVVVLKKPSPRKPIRWRAAFLNLKPDSGPRPVQTAIASLNQACEKAPDGSFEQRLARLSGDELDRAVLAVLFIEGMNLSFRESLRKTANSSSETGSYLPASTLVSWLSGGDSKLAEEIAKRIHPQSPLATEGFIERNGAHVPLEGTIRLSPALAGLMVADGFKSRLLEWGMKLEWPAETMEGVILNEWSGKRVSEAMEYARKEGRLSLLSWGEPGTGKTLMARALARELGRPLLTLESSNSPKDCGVLMRAFLAARVEGAVLFLDEFDRWAGIDGPEMAASTASGILLTHMEKFRGILVGATNGLPPRPFRRRFKYIIYFDQPGSSEAKKLWEKHLGEGADPETCEKLAGQFEMSGGLIANAVATAKAVAHGTMPDFKTLQEAAMGQFPNLYGWEEKCRYTTENTDAWEWISAESQAELFALSARMKAVKSWMKPAMDTSRLDGYPFHKALMVAKNGFILAAACKKMAEAAGVRPLYRDLMSLQREMRTNKGLNLRFVLNQMIREDFYPFWSWTIRAKKWNLTKPSGILSAFLGWGSRLVWKSAVADWNLNPKKPFFLRNWIQRKRSIGCAD